MSRQLQGRRVVVDGEAQVDFMAVAGIVARAFHQVSKLSYDGRIVLEGPI